MKRPIVLSIAGFDPTSGAGVTTDIKVFEQLKVYGFSVTSGITYQTENRFLGLYPLKEDEVVKQLNPLLEQYTISAVKIGMMPNIETLSKVLSLLKDYDSELTIIWDPILKASAGFQLHDNITDWLNILSKVSVLTPNLIELEAMLKAFNIANVQELSAHTAILLKGGHDNSDRVVDKLYVNGEMVCSYETKRTNFDKHGTGCVLSAALVSYLALGNTLEESCGLAKVYIQEFLTSEGGLLGYHNI